MFERYTERARRAIFFAREEANMLGGSQIDPEHILLGVIRENKNFVSHFFPSSRADFESIRKEIEKRTIQSDRVSTNIDLQLSSDSKRVLAYAAEESERLKHCQQGIGHVGIEHFLLGLLRMEDSNAAKILNESGVHLADLREDIESLENLDFDDPLPQDPDDDEDKHRSFRRFWSHK